MTRFARLLALAPVLSMLGGCPAIDLATRPGDRIPLEFEAVAAMHGNWLEHPEITVDALAGGVLVETLMSTPSPCQRFEARASEYGDTIRLDVDVSPVGEGCVAVIGTFEYVARMTELGPGTRRLVITHRIRSMGDGAARTVFDGEVVVR